MPIRYPYGNKLTRWHTQYLGSFDSAAGTPPFVTPPPPPPASASGLTPAPPPVPSLGIVDASYVPTKLDMQIVLKPMQSREQVSRQFSLRQYANGDLLKGGFW